MTAPHPEPTATRTSRRARGIAPDLWIAGIAAAIGGGAWAYDRHWQVGVLAGFVAWFTLAFVYPLPAWLFGWPQTRWIDAVTNGIDFLDMVVSLLSIFS